jgi:GAF domain-containing protein
VLKIISRSTFDLQIVLDTLTESAARLCEADMAAVTRQEGAANYWATSYGVPRESSEYRKSIPLEPGRTSVVGRTLIEGKPVYVPDVLTDPDWLKGPTQREFQRKTGVRSIFGVPLLRERMPIGIILVMSRSAEAFTGKQIELVETFAAQAVIAIENTRLLNELRESLQQQTATSEVLSVISRSKFDLGPILQSVVDTAAKLCRAEQGGIFRLDGGIYRFAAGHCLDVGYFEFEKTTPYLPGSGTIVGRAAMTRQVARIDDVLADPLYEQKNVVRNVRSAIGVPLMREGEPIGVIALARGRVEPFNDREVELIATFADQAVIAIENVRLFEGVEARTRELTRSLEELRNTQDRLVQTQKLASLGQLTAGIAHEIKNPLNFVNNFSGVSAEMIDELRQALEDATLTEKKTQ